MSTRKQAEDGVSLRQQREALEWAGVAPQNIYEDVQSGKTVSRPGFDALLKASQEGTLSLSMSCPV